MLRNVFAIVIVTVIAAVAYAQQPPTTEPVKVLEKQPFVLGPAVMQDYPEQDFFFLTSDATQKTMPEVMGKLMPRVTEAAKAAGIAPPSGPVLLVMNGLAPDPDARFEVEVGFICTPEIKASGDAQVRKLEPFKCVSMVYTGGFENMAKGYQSLFTGIMSNGKMPTMAIRQMVLYFEGESSTNNIMLFQVGIQ